jgi:hypothetical protein
MADGSDPLFRNVRTNQWMSLPDAITATTFALMAAALAPFLSASGRTKLTADTTINVPADYATLQEAWDHICFDLDLAGFTVTIQLADGTHTGGLEDYPVDVTNAGAGYIGGGYVIINGNPANPGNVIVTDSGDDFTIRIVNSYLWVQNFELQNSGGGVCLGAAWRGVIENGPGMRFGAAAAGQHIHASSGGQIRMLNDYEVVGGAGVHFLVDSEAQLRLGDITITLTGVPAFSGAFLVNGAGGLFDAQTAVYVGTATGPQWFLGDAAVCRLGLGGNITGLPGSTPGNTDTAFIIDSVVGPFPQVLASGSLAGNAVTITDIPLWVKKLTVIIINGSSNTATDYPKIQISRDNGASYITTGYNVSGVNLAAAILANSDSIVSAFTAVAAARNWTLYATIEGLSFGGLPSAYFSGLVDDISAVVVGGLGFYPISGTNVNAIRIKLNQAASAFDGGTYQVIGYA